LDIQGLPVEKYIRSYKPEKKKDVVDYLNQEFKIPNRKEYEKEVEETYPEINLNSSEVKQRFDRLKKALEEKKNSLKLTDYASSFSKNEKEELVKKIDEEFKKSLDKLDAYEMKQSEEEIKKFGDLVESSKKDYEEKYKAEKEEVEKMHNELLSELDEKYKKIKPNYEIVDKDLYQGYIDFEKKKIDDEEEKKRIEEEKEERRRREKEERS
jgi:hypothetical protein